MNGRGVKKILLTGATGVCGRAIEAHIRTKPDDFLLITTSRTRVGNPNHIVHDLSEALPIGSQAFPDDIDIVIHTASIVDEKTDSFDIIKSNIQYCYNAAKYARASNARALINLSSVAVYGSPFADRTYDEDSPCSPTSNYGLSKLLSEELFEACLSTRTRVINLRLGYVLSPLSHGTNIVARFYARLRNNLKVTLIDADDSFLPIVDVRDLAEICMRLEDTKFSGNLNVVGNGAPCIRDVFQAILSCVPESRSEICYEHPGISPIRAKYGNDALLSLLPSPTFKQWSETILWALRGDTD
jgi:nucleoside-diphosphate-sugar epimerase